MTGEGMAIEGPAIASDDDEGGCMVCGAVPADFIAELEDEGAGLLCVACVGDRTRWCSDEDEP